MKAPNDNVQGNHRLAADIGGTFTDVVLDTPAGRHTAEVPTTSGAPEAGVFEALDLLALVSCNDTGAERLRDMMAEFDLASIEPLADHIVERSRDAMLEAMRPIPNGRYGTEMTLDGYGEPVRVKAEMTVSDAEIVIDYGGTSRASAYGINSPLCYGHPLKDGNPGARLVGVRGFKHYSANRAIRTPDDMKGLKMRVMAPIFGIPVLTLGGSATPIAIPEPYTSLKTGVVDGQDNAVWVFNLVKLHEVQEYLMLDGNIYAFGPLVINDA